IETASYDPQTYTETYRGESGLNQTTSSGVNESQVSAFSTEPTEDHRSEQVAARSSLDGDAFYGEDEARSTKYETAAEFAPPVTRTGGERNNSNTTAQSPDSESEREEPASGLGWTGLGLSILSLFFMPYLLGPVGMVIGYMAFRRNARTLGTWSMIIGAVSILGAIIVYPYFVAR
ncbi:CD225/dispanin family protein, partial [Frankia sp. Cpl3]|nr:CD225/dispanin family protein [Frankia sp. Cpl3]